jgi:hypothetical protein
MRRNMMILFGGIFVGIYFGVVGKAVYDERMPAPLFRDDQVATNVPHGYYIADRKRGCWVNQDDTNIVIWPTTPWEKEEPR